MKAARFQAGDRVIVRSPETLYVDIRRKVDGRTGVVQAVFLPIGGRNTRYRITFAAPTPRHKEWVVVFDDRDLEHAP